MTQSKSMLLVTSMAATKSTATIQTATKQQQQHDYHQQQNDASLLFSRLNSDSVNGIFSFLSYRDCLTFGETSLSSLRSIQTELKNRQKRLTQSYVYDNNNNNSGITPKLRLLEENEDYKDPRCDVDNNNDDSMSHNLSNVETIHEESEDWMKLPTVRDRMEALSRALPVSHPMSTVVYEWLRDIDETQKKNISSSTRQQRHSIRQSEPHQDNNQDDDEDHKGNQQCSSFHFQNTLLLHQKHCRSHKLHAMILSTVLDADPKMSHPTNIEHFYGYFHKSSEAAGEKENSHHHIFRQCSNRVMSTTSRFLSVSLDRYIGDVLCATILMGHSVAGVVEGGPSEKHWQNALACQLGIHPQEDYDENNKDQNDDNDDDDEEEEEHVEDYVDDDDDDDMSLDGNVLLPRPLLSSSTPYLDRNNGRDEADHTTTTALIPVETWYRAWVYIHSTLLRVAPLAPVHRHRLRMTLSPPQDTNHDSVNLQELHPTDSLWSLMSSPSTAPHRPYVGDNNQTFLLQNMLRLPNWEPLRVTYNEFGRLGPVYRGRDMIHSHTIFPAGFINAILYFQKANKMEEEVASPQQLHQSSSSQSSFHHSSILLHLRRWFSGEDAVIQWLLQVHGSVGKTRPMTVVPPMACFRS